MILTPQRIEYRQLAGSLLAFALVLGGWVGLPVLARADNIDKMLIGRIADEIMNNLRQQKYENVGVLKFQVKLANRPPSFDVGLLNTNMATRLENALILANDEKKPIGITRNASQVAARTQKINSLNPEDCKTLFQATYPLAWGDKEVSVDAFLTGVVELSGDLKDATVKIRSFDQKNPQPQDMLNFKVKTDRSILSDTGMSFSLVKRDLKVKVRGDHLDTEAVEDAEQRLEGKPRPNDSAVENLLDLQVYYNGTPQKVIVDNETGSRKIPEPPAKAAIYFTVKSKERIGLVLRINGINTLNMEGSDRQVEECSKWVLEPGKEYTIKGFYMSDNRVLPFQVVSPQGLTSLDPERLGLIEAAVFREEANILTSKEFANLRSLSSSKAKPKTLQELQNQIMASAKSPKATGRGLIMPGEASGTTEVKATRFENPNYVGSLVIRYYP